MVQAIFRKAKPVQATGLPFPQFRLALQEAAALVGAQLQDVAHLLNETAGSASLDSSPVMAYPSSVPANAWDDTTSPERTKAVRQSKATSSSLPPILSVLSPPDPSSGGDHVR